MNDDPPPGVEYLDEWDSPPPPQPKRAGSGRMLVLSAAVIVVALVIALVLGGSQRRAVDPVTSTSPTTTATPTDMPSSYQVSTESPTAYQSIEVPDPAQAVYTPSPLPSDIEAEPLIIKVIDTVPKVADGAIAYRVSVCVSSSSSSVGGDKVRIRRDNWSGGTFTSGTTAPAADKVPIEPAFPADGLYGKGECATGYVTFSTISEKPAFLAYLDGRSGWYWMLG
jgi:hypothetical protein